MKPTTNQAQEITAAQRAAFRCRSATCSSNSPGFGMRGARIDIMFRAKSQNAKSWSQGKLPCRTKVIQLQTSIQTTKSAGKITKTTPNMTKTDDIPRVFITAVRTTSCLAAWNCRRSSDPAPLRRLTGASAPPAGAAPAAGATAASPPPPLEAVALYPPCAAAAPARPPAVNKLVRSTAPRCRSCAACAADAPSIALRRGSCTRKRAE
mmetsp:Transcript_29272/g.83181  ORF Transcript_29272/g.83181 Transcript_29272/m.83181 type:complete len:208 (-) Transcript_29272:113-736(-)